MSLTPVTVRRISFHIDISTKLATSADINVAARLNGGRVWWAKWVNRNRIQQRSHLVIHIQINNRDFHANISDILDLNVVADVHKASFFTFNIRRDQLGTLGSIFSDTGDVSFDQAGTHSCRSCSWRW